MINGKFSLWLSVKSGVPQGYLGTSIVCHLCKLLPTIVKSLLVLLADDTKLFCCIKSLLYDVKEIQKDIDALYCRSKQWLLSFDITKCKVLHIGTHHYLIPTH